MRQSARPLLLVLVLCGAGLVGCRGPGADEAARTHDPQRQRVLDFWNRLNAATEARTRHDFAGAARLYEEALVLEPRHEDGLYYLGQCRRELGEADAARVAFERLLEVNSASARGHLALGALFASPDPSEPMDLPKAERHLRRAHEINGEETGPVVRLGEIALVAGRSAEARRWFESALRTNPKSVEAAFLAGYLGSEAGDATAALVARVREALKVDAPVKGVLSEGDRRDATRVAAPPLSSPLGRLLFGEPVERLRAAAAAGQPISEALVLQEWRQLRRLRREYERRATRRAEATKPLPSQARAGRGIVSHSIMPQAPAPSGRPSEIVVVDGRVYHLGLRPSELAGNLFIVGDPARAYTVASRFDRVDHEVKHREFVTLTGSHRGLPVSVLGTGIGPDNVEIALVEAWALLTLDLASGLRRPASGPEAARPLTVLRIGTSGGTREDVALGTLVISSYAIGLDSTGLYYEGPPADETVTALEHASRRAIEEGVRQGSRFAGAFIPYASRATPALVAALERQAAAVGAHFVTGATVTAPGFFGPSGRYVDGLTNTVHDVKARLGRIEADGVQVLNMEMESSLLFHLAGLLGVRAGTICPTISNPAGHGAVLDPAPLVARAIDIALAAMHDVA